MHQSQSPVVKTISPSSPTNVLWKTDHQLTHPENSKILMERQEFLTLLDLAFGDLHLLASIISVWVHLGQLHFGSGIITFGFVWV